MRNPKKSDAKDDSVSDTTTSTVPPADAGGAAQSSPCPYAMGDIVLAMHGGRLYEAKVEKLEFHDEWRFFIHYRGWNKSWDEWVNSGRLLEPTPENMQKVCRDKKKDVRGKKQKKNPSSIRDKRKRDDAMDKGKDSVPLEKLVNISIPPSLKKQLMDDCESINQMGKLVKLPRAPNVNDIIEKYRDYRGKKDDVIPHSVGEVLSGLLIYFNNALPVMLLYNKEREQYQEAINDKISPAEIYGAEHLLRLFVKLPTLLYKVEIDEEALRELQQTLHDFLKFLQKNQGVFFLSTYHVPEATEGGIDKDCD